MLIMSQPNCMLVKHVSETVKLCQEGMCGLWHVKRIGVANRRTVDSEKEAPFFAIKERYICETNEYSVTLTEDIHVWLLDLICRACFIISLLFQTA